MYKLEYVYFGAHDGRYAPIALRFEFIGQDAQQVRVQNGARTPVRIVAADEIDKDFTQLRRVGYGDTGTLYPHFEKKRMYGTRAVETSVGHILCNDDRYYVKLSIIHWNAELAKLKIETIDVTAQQQVDFKIIAIDDRCMYNVEKCEPNTHSVIATITG